jgi:hypothetical protein
MGYEISARALERERGFCNGLGGRGSCKSEIALDGEWVSEKGGIAATSFIVITTCINATR